jgi:hypothetical protein
MLMMNAPINVYLHYSLHIGNNVFIDEQVSSQSTPIIGIAHYLALHVTPLIHRFILKIYE